jgi:hypothetical protein
MILEAQEAYFWGLQRAVAALCRSVLEETAEQIKALGTAAFADQVFDEKAILARLPDRLLNARGRALAMQIWEQGNRAVHDSTFSANTWETLVGTLRIVEAIANRGGLM